MHMAETMEDSGFDSDQRNMNSGDQDSPMRLDTSSIKKKDSNTYNALRKTSELQKKIERQREVNRKSQTIVDQQPRKVLPSRSRLIVPSKREASPLSSDQQPLVMIDTDESEDEFAVGRLSRAAQKEITQQLIKDGYNLDLEPDDEDLDLIPPKPLNERCVCCQPPPYNYCTIQ